MLLADICAGGLCGPPENWLIGGGAGGAAIVVGGITWAWLAWLRWLPAMGGFTRLRSDRLLDHPVRARLHTLVESHPGIHQQALGKAAGLGNGQAAHHLAVMVRGGILHAVRSKGFVLYFLKGAVSAPVMQGLSAVRSTTAVQALHLIEQQPGQGVRPLARELGCSESSLRHHVRRFAEAGLVEHEQGLHLLPLGEQVIAHVPFGRPPGG